MCLWGCLRQPGVCGGRRASSTQGILAVNSKIKEVGFRVYVFGLRAHGAYIGHRIQGLQFMAYSFGTQDYSRDSRLSVRGARGCCSIAEAVESPSLGIQMKEALRCGGSKNWWVSSMPNCGGWGGGDRKPHSKHPHT